MIFIRPSPRYHQTLPTFEFKNGTCITEILETVSKTQNFTVSGLECCSCGFNFKKRKNDVNNYYFYSSVKEWANDDFIIPENGKLVITNSLFYFYEPKIQKELSSFIDMDDVISDVGYLCWKCYGY